MSRETGNEGLAVFSINPANCPFAIKGALLYLFPLYFQGWMTCNHVQVKPACSLKLLGLIHTLFWCKDKGMNRVAVRLFFCVRILAVIRGRLRAKKNNNTCVIFLGLRWGKKVWTVIFHTDSRVFRILLSVEIGLIKSPVRQQKETIDTSYSVHKPFVVSPLAHYSVLCLPLIFPFSPRSQWIFCIIVHAGACACKIAACAVGCAGFLHFTS